MNNNNNTLNEHIRRNVLLGEWALRVVRQISSICTKVI